MAGEQDGGGRGSQWAADYASEAKELSATTAAILAQHIKHDDERFSRISDQLGTADKARHDLRNDMIGGFGELRVSVGQINKTLNDRFWTLAMAVIGILICALGYMIAKNGI